MYVQGVTFLSLLSCFFPIIPIVPSIRGYTQGCTNAIPTCFYYLRGIIRLDPQMFLRLLARVLSRKERDVFLRVSPISWAGNYLVSSAFLVRGKMLCQFCFRSQFVPHREHRVFNWYLKTWRTISTFGLLCNGHCSLFTGLSEMIVGVLTTCHTQYTWDRNICIFYLKEQHSKFLLHTL